MRVNYLLAPSDNTRVVKSEKIRPIPEEKEVP